MFYQLHLKQKKHMQAGFSLVELLVSIALFSVVITMSVGTMVVLLDANAKSQSMNVLMTNLSFAMSSMSREIRTGFSYYCNNLTGIPGPATTLDCPTGGTRLSVVETDNSLSGVARGSYSMDSRITYYFAPNQFGTDKGAIMRRVGTGAGYPITSAEIDIDSLEFRVVGSDTSASDPYHAPLARIVITGTAGDIPGLDTTFSIQTTVAQRLLDI